MTNKMFSKEAWEEFRADCSARECGLLQRKKTRTNNPYPPFPKDYDKFSVATLILHDNWDNAYTVKIRELLIDNEEGYLELKGEFERKEESK